MLLKEPLQAAARPEASLSRSWQPFSSTCTAASTRHHILLKHAAHAAPAAVDAYVDFTTQLPGVAMPVMRQLQQNQQQLQAQLEQARLQLQQQQHWQTPMQSSKPRLITNNSSGGLQQRALSSDMPFDPMLVQQLRDSIAAATTIQQLLQLMPAAAADKNADSVARVLLQAVRIQRSSDSSSHQDSPLQLSQNPSSQLVPSNEQHIQQQLHQLLQHCDHVLLQCDNRMMFQHVSAVLWSWAQLEWKPGSTTDSNKTISQGLRHDAQLLYCVVDRLKQCTVQHELSGKVPHAGSQLARAVTACAKLNIHDSKAWAKLHTMIETLSRTLSPVEVASCIWGLARSGQTAKTLEALPAYGALMSSAEQLVGAGQQRTAGFCSSDEDSGFTRVGALNVIWAVCSADLIDEAPANLLEGLINVVLGQQYSLWTNQQQQQQQQQQGIPAGQATAAESTAAATEGPVQFSEQLLPHEMSCLVWSLAVAARHSTRWTNNTTRQLHTHNQYQQQWQYKVPWRSNGKDSSSSSRKLQQHTEDRRAPYNDSSLLSYLVKLVTANLTSDYPSFGPRQIATIAYGFALLLQQQQQQGQFSKVQQQLLGAVVGLWFRSLRTDLQHDLQEFKLPEVHMLLQSVAVVQKQQQQQQQQQLECQGLDPDQLAHQQLMPARDIKQMASVTAAAAAAVLAAACQRVLAAQHSELQPRTAAGLLYVLSRLQVDLPHESTTASNAASVGNASTTDTSRSGSGGSSKSTGDCMTATSGAGAAAAVAEKLLNILSSSSAVLGLQDQQMVMLAVAAAGHLAAETRSIVTTNNNNSSSSSNCNGTAGTRIMTTTQAAALSCLDQLSLQLAAAASGLKLRELATTICAYATAQHSAPQLFDAVSRAVQQREILDHGSTWALARLLAAYATVGHTDERLFAAVVDALLPKLGVMQPRALARFAWALGDSGYHDLEVFRAVGAEILQRSGVGALSHKRVSHSTGGGEARASNSSNSNSSSRRRRLVGGVNAAPAAAVAAGAPAPLLHGFQARDVSALVWAFGTVGYKDPRPQEVLAQTGVLLFDQFTASQLAGLLWGLAAVGFHHEELINKVTTALSFVTTPATHRASNGTCSAESNHVTLPNTQEQQQMQQPAIMATASPADVSTLAWSLGELRCLTPKVIQSCAMHFWDNAQQYSSADAADLAWTVMSSGGVVQLLDSGGLSSPTSSSIAATTNTHTTSSSSSSYTNTRPNEASSKSCDSRDDHKAVKVNSYSLLQQLLMVVLQDLEQLTPQQLANTLLVSAVLNSAVGSDPLTLRTAGQVAVSNLMDGAVQQRQQLQLLQQQLVSCITSWGPGAFNAADGLKVLWAQLMLGQPLAEQQGHQQQQEEQKAQQHQQQQQAVVLQKLMSAGARAAVRHTALVCSSAFCQDVCYVVNSMEEGIIARPVLPSSAVAAKVATQAAHAAVAAATAMQGSMIKSKGGNNNLLKRLAGSTAGLPPTAAAAGSAGLWGALGAEVTAQLLGHVVLTVDGGSTSSDSSSSSKEVLLQLVPNSQLLRAESTHKRHGQEVDDTTMEKTTDASTAAPLSHDVWLQQITGGGAVAAGLLLEQQTCYAQAVIVTEAQWQQWAAKGQQAQASALQQLLM